jgi:hypothetical protein
VTIPPESSPDERFYHADLALDLLADGTIDVRGVSDNAWPIGGFSSGSYVLEGTGNAKFIIPKQ